MWQQVLATLVDAMDTLKFLSNHRLQSRLFNRLRFQCLSSDIGGEKNEEGVNWYLAVGFPQLSSAYYITETIRHPDWSKHRNSTRTLSIWYLEWFGSSLHTMNKFLCFASLVGQSRTTVCWRDFRLCAGYLLIRQVLWGEKGLSCIFVS
jgi:hypothetical protein